MHNKVGREYGQDQSSTRAATKYYSYGRECNKRSRIVSYKKRTLGKLAKKVQYQTFKRILEYLESSNKIMFNDREIIWIFPDNPKLKKLLETSVKL